MNSNQMLEELKSFAKSLSGEEEKSAFRTELVRLIHSEELKFVGDGTQIGIKCSSSRPFTLRDWSDDKFMPVVTGQEKVYQKFVPDRVRGKLTAVLTYVKSSGVRVTKTFTCDEALDVWLASTFIGALNCFPSAPNQDTMIAFSNLRTTYVDWSLVRPGEAITIHCGINKTLLDRVKPPEGFDRVHLAFVEVEVAVAIFGTAL